MRILKNLLLFLVSLIVSHLSAIYFGMLYSRFFPDAIGSGGIFLTSQEFGFYIAGIVAAYTFFLFLLFTAFGGKGKYWWAGILVLPAIAFEVYFDLPHIYFPIALGIIGWVIGLGVRKIFLKFYPSN